MKLTKQPFYCDKVSSLKLYYNMLYCNNLMVMEHIHMFMIFKSFTLPCCHKKDFLEIMLLGGVMGGITPTTWIVIRLLQFKTFLPFTLFSCLLLPFKTYNKCGYDNFWEGYLSAEWKIFSNLWGNIFHVGGCGLVLTGCCDWESDLGSDIKYKESHVSLSACQYPSQ